jgi:tetratricopeptide (TPR) repeat protein
MWCVSGLLSLRVLFDRELLHPNSYKERAIRYYVDDLAAAMIPGSRLSNILMELELAKQISENIKSFFKKKGLLALLAYSTKEITYPAFSKAAEIEQSNRRHIAEKIAIEEKARQKLEEEARYGKLKILQEQEQAKRRAFENDPRNIAGAKQFQLREKYGLSYFIEKTDFVKLMDILRRVDKGVRLSEEEVVWLSTKRDESYTGYFTEELREGFHKNEAKFYRTEFEKTKDPWFAVNASSHYRKCNKSRTAESLLFSIDAHSLKNRKLKSAIFTTHGGVKRDLEKWDEALNFGMQAHELTPQDFRPCTLVGAIYIETGHYDLGQTWFKKAVERGYSEKSVDDELRGIFMRAEKSKKQALRVYLLSVDPERYSWTNKK